jgi:hypothetical protein
VDGRYALVGRQELVELLDDLIDAEAGRLVGFPSGMHILSISDPEIDRRRQRLIQRGIRAMNVS